MPNPSGMPFEEKVRTAVDVPAPRDEFVQGLWTRISWAPRPPDAARSGCNSPAWIGLPLCSPR
jgi:hypothetical protein